MPRSSGGRIGTATSIDETDDGDAVARGRCDPIEHDTVVAHEARFQNEILGRITGDRQFSEDDDITTLGLGPLVRLENLLAVAVQIAHHGVRLSHTDSDRRHASGG